VLEVCWDGVGDLTGGRANSTTLDIAVPRRHLVALQAQLYLARCSVLQRVHLERRAVSRRRRTIRRVSQSRRRRRRVLALLARRLPRAKLPRNRRSLGRIITNEVAGRMAAVMHKERVSLTPRKVDGKKGKKRRT
jgi:hypothetical protein